MSRSGCGSSGSKKRAGVQRERDLRGGGLAEPEVLARHFFEARQPDCEMDYWLEAGKRTERSRNLEAMGHPTRALETLELLPRRGDVSSK